ncbi:Nn.00g072500.m01.CDS01 [Neocucurbitaria sp. VM-36]
MYIRLGVVTRLCWFLSFIVPFAQCQFRSNDAIAAKLEGFRQQGRPPPVDFDGRFGNRFPNGPLREGGRRRPPDDRIPSTDDEEPVEDAQPTQYTSTLRAAIPGSTTPPGTSSTLPAAIPSPYDSSVLPASTLRAAIPSPESELPGSTLRAAIPSLESGLPPSTLSAAIPTPEPTTSSLVDTIISSSSALPTSTVLTTTLLLPSSDVVPAEETTAPVTSSKPGASVGLPTPDPALAEENNTPARPSESSSAESTPLIPTAETAMSSASMAGMGVGVTFGVLSIAGAVGFFLWRRRQNQRSDNTSDNSEESNILGKLLGLKKYKDNKGDPEWSIESAEKVTIGKNMRAESVSTSSRSNSRGSDGSKPGSGAGRVNPSVVPSRRKLSMPTTALGSHPLTPDISSFPLPPTSSADVKASGSGLGEEKRANWPLSE